MSHFQVVDSGRLTESRKIFDGKHIVVRERDGWEFVERKKAKEAVAVIAITDDRKLILTEQFRRPVDARVIDWPAGLVGDEGNSDAAETARRELEEETGYACHSVELVASGPTSPGITSEIVHFYRARGLRRRGKGGGVGGEDITVHLVPLGQIEEWLRARTGALIDVKIWAGLYFVLQST
jgi:ADP-ribose pyrophosphatase